MSRQINQPINQVKLTNVAVVKYSYKGKRYEIACYRNKVMDFRSGFENDLSEVLQSDRIFTNVSKGQFAKISELEHTFGTRNEEEIARMILEKGDFQLSDLERQQVLENTLSQISTQIASNCVHPDTKRHYTVNQIKDTLANYHFQPHKPIKKQYLDSIKFLKQTGLPIERAKMELALRYPSENHEAVQSRLCSLNVGIVQNQTTHGFTVVHADPSFYRDLNDLATSLKGRLEILQQVVIPVARVEDSLHSSSQQLSTPVLVENHESALQSNGDKSDEQYQGILRTLQSLGIMQTEEESIGSSAQPHRKQQRQQQKKMKKVEWRMQDIHESDGNESNDTENAHAVVSSSLHTPTDAKICNTCGGSFSSDVLYRAHFRSDWHKFNQKLKLKGIPAVSEEEFKLCDVDTFFGRKDDDYNYFDKKVY